MKHRQRHAGEVAEEMGFQPQRSSKALAGQYVRPDGVDRKGRIVMADKSATINYRRRGK